MTHMISTPAIKTSKKDANVPWTTPATLDTMIIIFATVMIEILPLMLEFCPRVNNSQLLSWLTVTPNIDIVSFTTLLVI